MVVLEDLDYDEKKLELILSILDNFTNEVQLNTIDDYRKAIDDACVRSKVLRSIIPDRKQEKTTIMSVGVGMSSITGIQYPITEFIPKSQMTESIIIQQYPDNYTQQQRIIMKTVDASCQNQMIIQQLPLKRLAETSIDGISNLSLDDAGPVISELPFMQQTSEDENTIKKSFNVNQEEDNLIKIMKQMHIIESTNHLVYNKISQYTDSIQTTNASSKIKKTILDVDRLNFNEHTTEILGIKNNVNVYQFTGSLCAATTILLCGSVTVNTLNNFASAAVIVATPNLLVFSTSQDRPILLCVKGAHDYNYKIMIENELPSESIDLYSGLIVPSGQSTILIERKHKKKKTNQ